MRLLHVSDIHFKHPDCNSALDANSIYRAALARDVEEQCSGGRNVSAIFVTGDIAYRGIKEEYDAAKQWLAELVRRSGCPDKRVFVVPGNHDVNQKVIKDRVAVRNAIRAVFAAKGNDRERQLKDNFVDAETRRLLFAPLDAYNEFAGNFDCQVYPSDRLHWEAYIEWDGRTKLKVHGLTTTLLSGARLPDPDQLRDLYVSPLQTQLLPEDDVLNVVLGHHPPDWCSDCDALDEELGNRAVLHYFGHKHRARPDRVFGFMRFYGGAVNPDREEGDWEPGYSIADLKLEYKSDGSKLLTVAAHVRRWQPNPQRFVSVQDQDGSMTIDHSIKVLAGRGAVTPTPSAKAQPERAADTVNAAKEVPTAEKGSAPMNEATRDVFIRFFQMPRGRQTRLIEKLGLANGLEAGMPDHERFRRALLRAVELGLLEQLAKEMDAEGR